MAATPTSALGFQNFFSAILTGDITASSTDILMDAIPNATEGFLVIEPDSTTAREVIFYNSKTALKVVCPSAADGRGQDDTTAGAHSTGATVIMAPVAAFWEALQSGLSIAAGAVTTAKIADTAVTPAKLLAGTGTSWATTLITPTKTGWSSTTKNVWQYIQMGKLVWVYFDVSGTSNSTATNFTLPVAARSISATNTFEGTYGLAVDNGGVMTGPRWSIDISASTTVCNFYTTYGGAGWTASGSKQIRGFIFYEAA